MSYFGSSRGTISSRKWEASYEQVQAVQLDDMLRDFDETDQAKVMGGNLARLLELD